MRNIMFVFLFVYAATLSIVHAQDRVELQGTSIIGNRELPKVLYIVPWKKANADNLMGSPVGNMLREAFGLVDREVFLREVEYYERITSNGAIEATPKR